jgi:CubicO group peptidase (beta-lactamase class C family)
MVIQEVTGQPYETFIQQNIFDPLEMRHSYISQRVAQQHGMATGYRFWFGYPIAASNIPFVRGVAPAGMIISSAGDMAHYLTAQLAGGEFQGTSLLSEQGVAELHRPAAPMSQQWSYAMGWLVGESGGEMVLWHNGGTPDFYSYMAILPDSGWGMVLLVNVGNILRIGDIEAMAVGVREILQGIQPRDGKDASATSQLRVIYGGAVLILFLQLFWIARSIISKRSEQGVIAANRDFYILQISRPLLISLPWVVVVLVAFPAVIGTPLAVMILYAPDLMMLLLTSAGVAVGWGITQSVLRLRIIALN